MNVFKKTSGVSVSSKKTEQLRYMLMLQLRLQVLIANLNSRPFVQTWESIIDIFWLVYLWPQLISRGKKTRSACSQCSCASFSASPGLVYTFERFLQCPVDGDVLPMPLLWGRAIWGPKYLLKKMIHMHDDSGTSVIYFQSVSTNCPSFFWSHISSPFPVSRLAGDAGCVLKALDTIPYRPPSSHTQIRSKWGAVIRLADETWNPFKASRCYYRPRWRGRPVDFY